MGVLDALSRAVKSVSYARNPAEDYLRAKFPGLFANGERLPPPPQGWTAPDAAQPLPAAQAPTTPAPDAVEQSPASQMAAAQQPQAPARKTHGLLGALKSVFLPEAGTFMYSALNNPNGLWGASGAREAYATNQHAAQLAQQKAELDIERARTKGEYQIVGNNVFHIKPDGTTEMISAPAQPGETERLIEKWRSTPAGPERDLIERAIRGYQYTPPVINAKADAAARVGATVARVRGSETRKTNAAKPSATGGVVLPAGAKIIP